MAIMKTDYPFLGIQIEAYAKINTRHITDFVVEGVKKYSCIYDIKIYTSDTKEGVAESYQFEIIDGELPTIEMCYADLKLRTGFDSWEDV